MYDTFNFNHFLYSISIWLSLVDIGKCCIVGVLLWWLKVFSVENNYFSHA